MKSLMIAKLGVAAGVLVVLVSGGNTLAGEGVVKRPKFPDDIEKAIAGRRGRTALSKLAASMKPGTWAELKCKRPPGLMAVNTGTKYSSGKIKKMHIAGWTDDGHWDSRTGQFFYMGFRIQLKFIAYAEEKNEWRVLPGPFGWDAVKGVPGKGAFKDTRRTHFGHVYSRNAHDVEGGAFYHTFHGYTYRYDVAAKKWTRFRGGGGMVGEYFPGLGFMYHASSKNKSIGNYVETYDAKAKTWKKLAKVPLSPHHALARYNHFHKEMLLIAGNDHQTVVKVDAKGKVTRLKDTPEQFTVRHGKLLVDPLSGRYLMFVGANLYEFDSVKNEYRKVAGYKSPFSKYEMPVPAAIPEYGVIMWIDKKVRLYKHKLSTAKPLAGPAAKKAK